MYVQILETVLKECGRGNTAYQASALEALGKILTSTEYKRDYFTSIYDKLKAIILTVSCLIAFLYPVRKIDY